ncbi:MAG: di-trans,poly-cis-decaprenylcistransferase, partial [Candidatus Omnitrophota bacterium]
GRITALPSIIQLKLKKAEARTVNNKDIFVNLALNYGARTEIVDATKKIAKCVKQNELNPEDISENNFSDYLYTAGLPDPDILIRTSGEMRVSNFLLWQISYTEIYITKKLWPDFRKKDLEKAVLDCQERDRRYGG